MGSTGSSDRSREGAFESKEVAFEPTSGYEEARASLASLDGMAKHARAQLDETSRPLLWLGVIFLVGGLILLFADLIDSKGEAVNMRSTQARSEVVATTFPPTAGSVGGTEAQPPQSVATAPSASSPTLHSANEPSFYSRNIRHDVAYGVGVAGTALAVLLAYLVLLVRSTKGRGTEGARHRDPWYWLSLLLFFWWIPLDGGMFVGIVAGLMLIIPAIRLYSWEMAAAGIGSSLAFTLFLLMGSGPFFGLLSVPYFVTGAILFGTGRYLRRAM